MKVNKAVAILIPDMHTINSAGPACQAGRCENAAVFAGAARTAFRVPYDARRTCFRRKDEV